MKKLVTFSVAVLSLAGGISGAMACDRCRVDVSPPCKHVECKSHTSKPKCDPHSCTISVKSETKVVVGTCNCCVCSTQSVSVQCEQPKPSPCPSKEVAPAAPSVPTISTPTRTFGEMFKDAAIQPASQNRITLFETLIRREATAGNFDGVLLCMKAISQTRLDMAAAVKQAEAGTKPEAPKK